jgi:hypothetical protein
MLVDTEESHEGDYVMESFGDDSVGGEGMWHNDEESSAEGIWVGDEESSAEGTWDSDEESSVEGKWDNDEESGGKSFQWLDADEMGRVDDDDIWDDDYEIRDTFVLSDEDIDEDRSYAEAVFEVYDSYSEAGDAIASWDEDDAEDFFEIIEETPKELRSRVPLTKKKLKKKRKKGVKAIWNDKEFVADWDD